MHILDRRSITESKFTNHFLMEEFTVAACCDLTLLDFFLHIPLAQVLTGKYGYYTFM